MNTVVPRTENVFEPKNGVELAKIADVEMAENRFVAAVACSPTNEPDAALIKTDRALRKPQSFNERRWDNSARRKHVVASFKN
jgi:23S rRNA G2069 N7-methylase RlmK/C1962 C5-methylase RlmI